ncbi:hypothetical protein ABID21_003978 [Pseudorhizobium tarimense]|uniref:Transposase n=1 Tax=Pseudorhizobium tarimense TaxID=1079109 RepID=A0ABV2HBB5_9HYPH
MESRHCLLNFATETVIPLKNVNHLVLRRWFGCPSAFAGNLNKNQNLLKEINHVERR